MLNFKEAAKKFDLSVETLRRYIKQGKIRANKIGKSYFIEENDIDELKLKDRLKNEADLLVKDALESQDDITVFCNRDNSLRRAKDMYLKLEDKELAERADLDSIIFSFVLKNIKYKISPKDNRFAPAALFTDADDNVFYNPDPAWIDDKMLKHVQKRVSEVSNPLTLAIYYDLLFEYSKEKNKIPYAQEAIKSYEKAAKIYYLYGDKMFAKCQDCLIRVFEITLKIGADDKKSDAIRTIILYTEQALRDSQYRFPLELLEVLVDYHKHLDQKQIEFIFTTAKYCSSYFEQLERPKWLLQQRFIQVCVDLSRKLEKLDEKTKYKKQIAYLFIKEAQEKASEGGLIQAGLLEQAYDILKEEKALDAKDEQKLIKQIEEAYLRSEKEMIPISTEITIPQKQIEDFIAQFVTDDVTESLMRIGTAPNLIPALAEAKKTAENEARECPFQYLSGRALIQDGKKISTIPGSQEVNKKQEIAVLGRNVSFNCAYLSFIFEALKAKGVNGKTIAEYLKNKDFFQYDNFKAIQQGLEVLDQEYYFSAMSTIVPQIEELLRKVLRRLGKPSSKVDRGIQRAMYINEILESLRLDIGEDKFWYLYLVLHDKNGPAIRNNLAHGLYRFDPSNKQDSYLILHILLILASFLIQVKADTPCLDD